MKSFEDEHLSTEFKGKKGRKTKPILPFACEHRFEAGCQPSVGWKEKSQGHLSPLERVAKTRKMSKGGQVKLYLSGKETEPPFLMQNLVADVIKREYALMRSVHWKRLSLPDGKPRWFERLLWEFITSAPKGTITTLPLDAPIEAWPGDERRIPLLNFIGADHDKEKGKRFNRKASKWLIDRVTDSHPPRRIGCGHGKPPTARWKVCSRSSTPDVSMGELLDLAAMNGIGVAVAIDAWSADGLPETDDMFGPADTDWYISGDLFGKNEPQAYRTYGSFLGALNANKQLNIEVDQVKHERRVFGCFSLMKSKSNDNVNKTVQQYQKEVIIRYFHQNTHGEEGDSMTDELNEIFEAIKGWSVEEIQSILYHRAWTQTKMTPFKESGKSKPPPEYPPKSFDSYRKSLAEMLNKG